MKSVALLFMLIPIASHAEQESSRHSLNQGMAVQKMEESSASILSEKNSSEKSQSLKKPRAAFGTGYAWDQVNHRGKLVWGCRSVLTEEYVDKSFCSFQKKNDSQWPDKKMPGNYEGES